MIGDQMLTVRGIGAAPGVAIGQVHLIRREEWEVPRRSIDEHQVGEEVDRFNMAIQASLRQVEEVLDRLSHAGTEGILIIEAHRMMLQDEMLVERTREAIRQDLLGAENALDQTLRSLDQAFSQLTEVYFRERAADLRSVGHLIMSNLLGHVESPTATVPPEAVVVAHELTATQAADLTLRKIKALVTEVGGVTCHTAIMARAMEIPAVVGVTGICMVASNGQQLAVDGNAGQVILSPDPDTIRRLRQERIRHLARQTDLLSRAQGPAVTLDGVTIRLEGNIEYVEEIESLWTHGGTGIGLFRTEYLLLQGTPAGDEDSQVEVYRRIVDEIAPHGATLRTLDVGGGKAFGGLRLNGGTENPALGLRGIRLSLLERDMLKVQLRALLRASAYGKIRLLIPFVTSLWEVRAVKELLAEAKEELRREQKPFDETIPFGVMIEVPSAAITVDILAREVDFFSIGTNDLVQYILAVDRNNQTVAQLYHSLHPSVLRLLRQIVLSSQEAGVEVAICGEMAGEPQNIPVLLGCGLTSFSMNPISIPPVKDLIRRCNYSECREFFDRLADCSTISEITERVREYYHLIIGDDTGQK